MVERLADDNGCRREDILAVIGPSICKECYEVSDDVADRFAAAFPEHIDSIAEKKSNGKYMLDLWEANRYILLSAGIKKSNLEIMISHRKTGGIRGSMAGVVVL